MVILDHRQSSAKILLSLRLHDGAESWAVVPGKEILMFDEKLLMLLLFMTIPIALRIRRDMGFQRADSGRITVRRLGLSVLALLLTALMIGRSPLLAGLTWAISLSLTTLSLRMTTFENRTDGIWFRTNPWIGGSLAALLVGRIAYRVYELQSQGDLSALQDYSELGVMCRSPLSLMIALLLFSYFGVYYNLVARHVKKFSSEAGV